MEFLLETFIAVYLFFTRNGSSSAYMYARDLIVLFLMKFIFKKYLPSLPMRQSIIEKIEKRITKIIPTTTVGFSKPERKMFRRLERKRGYELDVKQVKACLIHLLIFVYLVYN